MFVYEFGNSAYVIKDGDCVAAYLFGFTLADGADRLFAFGGRQDR
jgi:hypothetical protein